MVSVGLILSYTSLSVSDVPSTVPFLCKRTCLPDYSIYRLKPVNRVSHSSSRVTSCASWANHFSTTTAHTLLTKLKSPISRFPTAYSNKDQSERIWPLLLNFLQPGAIEKHSYFSANKSNAISVPELRSDFHTRKEGLEYHGTWARGPFWSLSPLSLAYYLGGRERVKMKENAILILNEGALLKKTIHGVVIMAFCFSER